MNLGPYINDLLFRYDCVIVPGFGGFVGNYAPARVHPVQHRFYPPCKQITFNRHLQNNDGLLANLISQDTGCAYEKAMDLIREEVERIDRSLKDGKKMVIEKIGIFTMDEGRNILFEPDLLSNYLPDSYGLLSFRVLPVKKETGEPVIRKVQKEPKVISIHRKQAINRAIKITAAASVLFAMFWIPLKTDLLEQANLHHYFSGIVEKPVSSYQPGISVMSSDKPVERYQNLAEEMRYSPEGLVWSFLDEDERMEGTPAVIHIAAETTPAPEINVQLKYHVVGGCFEFPENAETLVKRLLRKGYDARRAGTYHKLHVVSYGSFATRNEALELLETIKNKENTQAWLLRN